MSFKFLVSNARRSGFSTSSACGPSRVFPALDKTALTDPLSFSPELQNPKGVISEFRIFTKFENLYIMITSRLEEERHPASCNYLKKEKENV